MFSFHNDSFTHQYKGQIGDKKSKMVTFSNGIKLFRSVAMSCSCRLFGLTLCLSGLALSLYAYYVEEMMEASAGKYTMNDLMKWFRFEYRREM